MPVSRLELGFLILSLDGNLPGDWLLWVLLVVGELGERLIVALARRVRRPERLVVQLTWSSLRRGGAMRNRRILLKNLAIGVEGVCVLGTLREVLVLQLRVVVLTLSSSELLRSIVIVLNVGDSSAKCDLLANLASLDWVRLNVSWLDQHFTRILFATEVLLDLNEVGHVLVGRLNLDLDHALRLEWLLVTNSNLMSAILLSAYVSLQGHVWVTNARVGHTSDQDLIDGGTLFDRISPDVGRVDHDLSRVVSVLVHSSCIKSSIHCNYHA